MNNVSIYRHVPGDKASTQTWKKPLQNTFRLKQQATKMSNDRANH